MLSVAASRARKSSTSSKPMSAPTPVEMTVENPTCRERAQSSVAAHNALDCETSASRPRLGSAPPQAALSPLSVRITPKLFGPSRRRPYRRATFSIERSQAAPSSPPSRNPADTMTAPRTPRSPQCSSTVGTVCGGVAMTARSTAWGNERTSGKAGAPPMVACRGIDAEDRPAKPAFAQVPAQDLADRSRLVARADHGHGCGAQHGLDAFRSHGSSVLLGVRRTRKC